MSAVEFVGWPKIARLNRGMTVTEKIDGTNAAIRIVPVSEMDHITYPDTGEFRLFDTDARNAVATYDEYVVFAQSRNRLINIEFDNYGFAKWVQANAQELVEALGEGLHFGEWWGSGIQRGYGLTKGEKRFSLFNTSRYEGLSIPEIGLGVVPVLYQGAFDTHLVEALVNRLDLDGSTASLGFMDPEGVVVYLAAARSSFKVTIKNDDKPKGLAA